MPISLKTIAFAALCLVALMFAGIAAYFVYQNAQLQGQVKVLSAAQADSEAQISQLQGEQASLAASYAKTGQELEQQKANVSASAEKIALLEAMLSDKEKQINETKVNLQEQQAKAASIATDLYALESSVNASMAWFRENAALPGTNEKNLDTFKQRMYSDCVDGGELNLACISYLMENTAFSIHYRTDPESTGKADFLQSVQQTIDTGWGDCEDYSLIFKAELNTVKQQHTGLVPIAFTGGNGTFRVYPKESTPEKDIGSFWYVQNAAKVRLGSLDSLYPYVICFRQTEQNGHCTVALSQNRIENTGQVQLLAGAQVFEPQSGQYLGTVGNEYTICSDDSCLYRAHAIMLVISDSDLYKFDNGKWAGFADYGERISAELQLLGG